MQPVDLVLVEGYKSHPFPKLEVHRPALGKPPIWPESAGHRGGRHRRAGQRRPRAAAAERSRRDRRLDSGGLMMLCHTGGTFREVLERGAWPGHIPPRLARPARRSDDLFRWEPLSCGALSSICLCLALSGCGYNTWSDPPFATGSNPNMPVEREREHAPRHGRAGRGTDPLTPEPGDVWPGPLPPSPTLQDLEAKGEPTQPQRPVPGSPQFQGQQPPNLPPPPATHGSSTPPPSNQPGLATLPAPTPPRPTDSTPPARNPAGQVVPDAAGPGSHHRGHQQLPDHHDPRRRFRNRRPQWQWHQHDHTFGRQDRDGPHTALNQPWPTPKHR